MKCLILAAGKGSRLWKKGDSKPLTPLLGVPIIERVIRSAIKAGIDDFTWLPAIMGRKYVVFWAIWLITVAYLFTISLTMSGRSVMSYLYSRPGIISKKIFNNQF